MGTYNVYNSHNVDKIFIILETLRRKQKPIIRVGDFNLNKNKIMHFVEFKALSYADNLAIVGWEEKKLGKRKYFISLFEDNGKSGKKKNYIIEPMEIYEHEYQTFKAQLRILKPLANPTITPTGKNSFEKEFGL